MAATGARAAELASHLVSAGWAKVLPPRLPHLVDLSGPKQDQLRGLYDLLGGDPAEFHRIRPGSWDLAVETPSGLLLVELDEEQHFNRYRLLTLDANADLGLPWTTAYMNHCWDHEQQLLPGWGTGQRWTNPSAARFFGDPSSPGDFTKSAHPDGASARSTTRSRTPCRIVVSLGSVSMTTSKTGARSSLFFGDQTRRSRRVCWG